ncbi:hypothetical protein JHK82_050142 [Glycine max]|nr:hypothetical protein JHK82_050142 [Glycine max]
MRLDHMTIEQDIPDPPRNMEKLHKIDMRGRTDTNWVEKHAKWIRLCSTHIHTHPPMKDYIFPSLSNMDYTPLIVQLDDFVSNVFGTDCGMPASSHEYMHSLRNKVELSFNLMFSQDVEENNPSLHDIPDKCLCQNPGRNGRHPPCGTRHHYGD